MIEIVLLGAVRRMFGTEESRFLAKTDGPVSVREALDLAGLDVSGLNQDRILALREGESLRLSVALDSMLLRQGEKLSLMKIVQGG